MVIKNRAISIYKAECVCKTLFTEHTHFTDPRQKVPEMDKFHPKQNTTILARSTYIHNCHFYGDHTSIYIKVIN